MSGSSISNTHQAGGQVVSPTQLLVKELIQVVQEMSKKIEILTHQVSQMNMKIDILAEEEVEEGVDVYDLDMDEPTTPKKAKYKPNYNK